MRVLHLTLHRRWFAAIARGEKREEYRSLNSAHWRQRLEGRIYDEVHFRNGYSLAAPFMRVEFCGVGRGVWQGAECYVIRLGRVLEVRNCPAGGGDAQRGEGDLL